ncbi:recombinase family protein [Anoxybacillus gonensis]|uniref:recombinase family protein n=1 Tax=Anoxybacillus gonensis TaxID=198467 RepID=UPI0002BEF7DC|nr:recombinase family protein [Anoxybacillus gonensis]EMI11391.1 Resolvase [Anoxybacillus gonensis]
MTKPKAAIYVRVSTEEQSKGFSLEGQKYELLNYIKHKGYDLYDIYEDDGYSGKNFDRPAVQRMLRDIENKKLDAVVVWKVDRLSRENTDVLNLINYYLHPNGMKLLVSTCDIDSSTETGYMFISLLSTFAKYERQQIIQRVNNGMKKRAQEGKWNGGIILGYDVVDKKLVVNREESKIVQEIFQLRAQGKGYKFIANYLNSKGLKTKKGNSFSINAVRAILQNQKYLGVLDWGKHQEWDKKRRSGQQESVPVVEGEHEAIIDQELWNRVVQINKEQKENHIQRSNFKGEFVLAGILKCPMCGAGMVMSKTKKRNGKGYHLYYMCQTYHTKGSTACKSNLVKKELIEEKVLNTIKSLLLRRDIVKEICEQINSDKSNETADLKQQLTLQQKELKKLENQRKKVENDYLQGELDVRVYNKTMLSIQNKEDELNEVIRNLEMQLEKQSSTFNINEDLVIEALSNFENLYDTADNETKKMLLRSIIKSIEVDPNRKEIKSIVFWFLENNASFENNDLPKSLLGRTVS